MVEKVFIEAAFKVLEQIKSNQSFRFIKTSLFYGLNFIIQRHQFGN